MKKYLALAVGFLSLAGCAELKQHAADAAKDVPETFWTGLKDALNFILTFVKDLVWNWVSGLFS